MNKEVIKKHWNGISTIPKLFGALSFTFIAKGTGIYDKTSNLKKNVVDTFFSRYDHNFFLTTFLYLGHYMLSAKL